MRSLPSRPHYLLRISGFALRLCAVLLFAFTIRTASAQTDFRADPNIDQRIENFVPRIPTDELLAPSKQQKQNIHKKSKEQPKKTPAEGDR